MLSVLIHESLLIHSVSLRSLPEHSPLILSEAKHVLLGLLVALLEHIIELVSQLIVSKVSLGRSLDASLIDILGERHALSLGLRLGL